MAVLHDDVDSEVALVDAPIVVADDVRVVQISQNVDFGNDLLLLFLSHLAIVQFLPDENASITYPSDLAHIAETTCNSEI